MKKKVNDLGSLWQKEIEKDQIQVWKYKSSPRCLDICSPYIEEQGSDKHISNYEIEIYDC